MNNVRWNKVFATAKTEYVKWICNTRMILMLVLLIFIYQMVTVPLLEHAQIMQTPLNVLEPFIAAINSEVLIVIIPLVFLVLFSDFPRTDGNTLFFLQRTGRVNWILGQVVFCIMAIFTYILILLLGSMLPILTKGFWANYWSLAVSEFNNVYPEQSYSFASLLIRENIYNQVSPWYATVVGYGMIMLYLFVNSLILLTFNSLGKKIFGILFVGAVIAFGGVTSIIKLKAMWLFPMAHSSIWMHFTQFFRKEIMPMRISVLYFVMVILGLLVISIRSLKKMNYESIQELD